MKSNNKKKMPKVPSAGNGTKPHVRRRVKPKESAEEIASAKRFGKPKCSHGYYWPNNECICWESRAYGCD